MGCGIQEMSHPHTYRQVIPVGMRGSKHCPYIEAGLQVQSNRNIHVEVSKKFQGHSVPRDALFSFPEVKPGTVHMNASEPNRKQYAVSLKFAPKVFSI